MNRPFPWRLALRSTGFWLAVVIVASQLLNAIRVALDPLGFSAYMGLPLSMPADASWVGVYGLRALFLGTFAAVLLFRQRFKGLGWMAGVAVVLPLGDFLLAHQAGAAPATLIRHAVIGLALIAAAFFLSRLANRTT